MAFRSTCDQFLTQDELLLSFHQGGSLYPGLSSGVNTGSVCAFGGGDQQCFFTDVFSFLATALYMIHH